MSSLKVINAEDFPTLQAAVDAVPEYGVVSVGPGEWKCGAVKLKSNMTLRLAAGCRLLAPDTVEEHARAKYVPEERVQTHFFIGAEDAENIIIEGDGIIDCRGHLFWENFDNAPMSEVTERLHHTGGLFSGLWYKPIAPPRPSGMQFWYCRNIQMRGVTVYNSSTYTIWALGCQKLRFDGISIINHRRGPNTDGLDIDCSSDVWINNCYLDCGDDAVALKSDIDLVGKDYCCERIHITNCKISSTCCAIRLGYEGDGIIRDVVFSNNIIRDTNIGIDILSIIPYHRRFNIMHGSPIENILFTSCTMRNVRQPFKIWGYPDPDDEVDHTADYQGYVRNAIFSDMVIESTDAAFVGGLSVNNVTIKDIYWNLVRDPQVYYTSPMVDKCCIWGKGFMLQPLTIRTDEAPVIKNVNIKECYRSVNNIDMQCIKYRSPLDDKEDYALFHASEKSHDCVVFLHGHGSNGLQIGGRADLQELLQEFVDSDLNVVAPNLRGNNWMNPEAVQDLNWLLTKLKAEHNFRKYILVSGSMGGTGALIFAGLHPELVDGMVIAGAATDIGVYLEWCKQFYDTENIRSIIGKTIEERYTADALSAHSACSLTEKLTMPIYYSHGGADEIIPVSEARNLCERMAGKTNFHYEEIPGGDHDSPLRRTDEDFRSLLKDIL